ncbi:hypothetical protein HK101_001971 [Irineochytrium annulatum]|nr:hypothetical protein HK101_001971 [Irineochytrium annulatum]
MARTKSNMRMRGLKLLEDTKHQAERLRKGIQDAIADNGSLHPIVSLLSGSQLQAVLLAFLPSYLAINTGNVAVDMFLITFCVTVCMALLNSGGNLLKALLDGDNQPKVIRQNISVKVEFHRFGKWGQAHPNTHWTALAWLISLRSKSQKTGSFRMATFESEKGADDEYDIPEFNILPRGDSTLQIEHEGAKFEIYFERAENADEGADAKKKLDRNEDSIINQEPPIIIQRIDDEEVTLEWMQNILNEVTRLFHKHQKEKRSRARYERHSSYNYWQHVQNLRACRGLTSVALDRVQEELLTRDLETFHSDETFYKRMGLPYRRGYLFSGKPGTGKTSLVNAISATYNRNLYYMNLKEIRDDSSLQSAFSSVPRNSIIVFEDIDAQSGEVHSRDRRFTLRKVEKLRLQREKKRKEAEEKKAAEEAAEDDEEEADEDGEPKKKVTKTKGKEKEKVEDEGFMSDSDDMDYEFGGSSSFTSSFGPSLPGLGDLDSKKFGGLSFGRDTPLFSGFTLSALLNCLDGHMMNENVIVIMTTNHPEVLDPALIRPGRIDLHLELGYCTRYQLTNMYRAVMDDREAVIAGLERIEEGVIAPCDALRIMVLYRSNPGMIPVRLAERCREILDGKPVTSGLRAGEGAMIAPEQPVRKVSKVSTEAPSRKTSAVAEEKMVGKDKEVETVADAEAEDELRKRKGHVILEE